jgi:transposase-like protein
MPYAPPRPTQDETLVWGEDEIVCPFCDHKHSESWTWHEGEGSGFEMECEECDKKFWVELEYSVSYTCWKYKEETNEQSTPAT